MYRTTISMVLAMGLLPLMCGTASALNSTCETGNEATFETLAEAHQHAPDVVRTYEGNNAPDRRSGQVRTFAGHPALDNYPAGTTFVYRSPNMYGGRAAARLNTNLIVYVDRHFDNKDTALAYLKAAGLIDIANEATGSIVLVTPAGETFGSPDIASYYALQTAMLSQKATGTLAGRAHRRLRRRGVLRRLRLSLLHRGGRGGDVLQQPSRHDV